MTNLDSLNTDQSSIIYSFVSLQEKYDILKNLKNDPSKRSDYIQFQNMLLDLNPEGWTLKENYNIVSWSFLTSTSDEKK